jgi:hypothetical protein
VVIILDDIGLTNTAGGLFANSGMITADSLNF